jgi:membrane protease YdiL (CAAX protease family)
MKTTSNLNKQPWQKHYMTQILAVIIVYAPIYIFALLSHLNQQTITLRQLFLYPLLLGGGNVVLILLIYRYVLKEDIATFNLKAGKWYTDILFGILLTIIFLGLLFLQQVIQSKWLPRTQEPPPQELITLFTGIVHDPFLLAIWLGPVAWLGVAAFEEMSRVFMLNRLWSITSKPLLRWVILVISAILFGFIHIYQGTANVISITIQGLIYGLFYMRFGRVWSMIIGHALYDSLQIIQVVIVFSEI